MMIKGKSLKIMCNNFSFGFSGKMEIMDEININVKKGLSLFDYSEMKSKQIELKYKRIIEGNNCVFDA